eukprot:CAMPEP_0115832362 /NCGR_PEP_ID=MMETSP0287-20121206/2616_1 /TAXON_ID=412157 /ORGANISM="Chrysochromulina rotalis, Strain UIO044" /LENGTH=83 /DNA_ID=CAMNT_0003285739 /DNA_START=162 /DNA_END=414 /DNA_ORIENTATION=+
MSASMPLNAATCRRCRSAEDEGIAIVREEHMGPKSDRLLNVAWGPHSSVCNNENFVIRDSSSRYRRVVPAYMAEWPSRRSVFG